MRTNKQRLAPSRGLFIVWVALATLPAAQAAGDAKLGADVFATHCAECHSLKEGKHKKGPSLFALVGRNAGAQADFKYSAAMKAIGWTWSPDRLDPYLTLPNQALPGGAMKYEGLADAKARADLIAYFLRSSNAL